MLVSVVMPVFNSERFVEGAIQSVIDQTFADWELVVVDDCSSDRSEEIVQACMRRDSRIRFISMSSNAGAARARNAGIEVAQGRYIAFLDSDDLWYPRKLECQLDFMRCRGIGLSFTGYDRIDAENRWLESVGVPQCVDYRTLLKCNVIGCLTAVYDTRVFGKVFMPLLRKRQDFGLWLQLLRATDYAHGLNVPLARYRVGREGSVSADKRIAAAYNWKLYRDIEQLGLLMSSYCFAQYAVRGLIRTRFPWLGRRLGLLHTVERLCEDQD